MFKVVSFYTLVSETIDAAADLDQTLQLISIVHRLLVYCTQLQMLSC